MARSLNGRKHLSCAYSQFPKIYSAKNPVEDDLDGLAGGEGGLEVGVCSCEFAIIR